MWFPPVWRTVPRARRYAVSDRGQVRNHRGLLALRLNDEGYVKVKLVCDDGKRRDFFVHRLVADSHLPPPLADQIYVLHRDGGRQHNYTGNLRWGTHLDNHLDKIEHGTLRSTKRKLTMAEAISIRSSSESSRAVAARLRLSLSHVREIRSGRKWSTA